MPTLVSPAAISGARKLRRNLTQGERKLWSELRVFRRLYGIHVRKQAPIGPYVADFAIHSHGLLIEVDASTTLRCHSTDETSIVIDGSREKATTSFASRRVSCPMPSTAVSSTYLPRSG